MASPKVGFQPREGRKRFFNNFKPRKLNGGDRSGGDDDNEQERQRQETMGTKIKSENLDVPTFGTPL